MEQIMLKEINEIIHGVSDDETRRRVVGEVLFFRLR